jgi:hypothetical protein
MMVAKMRIAEGRLIALPVCDKLDLPDVLFDLT